MSYTRVNWNSTTTYVSADNLNIMDKGIKDLDTNIGDVTTLTTTAKTVVPAIKELKTGLEALNNNLDTIICTSSQLINASIITVNYSYLAKKAGVIQLALDIAFSLSNAATIDFQTIFTIPEEFRPSGTVLYQRSKGTATFYVRVNAITGDVGVFTQHYADINTIRDTVFYIGK